MSTKQFFEHVQEITGAAKPWTLSSIRNALAAAGILPGWTNATPHGAAWMLYATACAPGVKRPELDAWIEAKRSFFLALKNKNESDPITFLSWLFSDPAHVDGIDAILIERITGTIMISDAYGFRLLSEFSDVPAPDAPTCVYLPAPVIRAIAENLQRHPAPTLN